MASRQHGSQLQPNHVVPELPEAALSAILQHMPLRQRLRACAVCKDWKAVAATLQVHVDADVTADVKRMHLQNWLANFASSITSVRLVSSNAATEAAPVLVLPKLPKLLVLHLTGFRLQLPVAVAPKCSQPGCSTAGSASTGSFVLTLAEPFPRLQSLSLVGCRVREQQLMRLVASTSLTKLHFVEPKAFRAAPAFGFAWPIWGLPPYNSSYPATIIPELLQKVPNLSDLLLRSRYLSQAALAPVSSMQRLQQLSLNLWDGADTILDTTSALPTTLTRLELVNEIAKPGGYATVAFKWGMSFTAITALQQLRLSDLRDLNPGILAEVSGLQHLQLAMEAPAAGQVQHWAKYSPAALLRALQGLTRVQHLELFNCNLHTLPYQQQQQQQPLSVLAALEDTTQQQQQQQDEGSVAADRQEQEAGTPACFSVLTASSQLTVLCISQTGPPPLPSVDVLETLFPPGRVFDNLKVVRLERQFQYSYGSRAATEDFRLSTQRVMRLGQICPTLQELGLGGVLSPTFNVNCLSHLPTSVTALHGLQLIRPEAAQVARLTQLRSLSCSCMGSEALLQLTGLTGLTELHVGVLNLVGKPSIGPTHLVDLQQDDDPDVWRQVHQLYKWLGD